MGFMVEYLFVGGSADGTRKRVARDKKEYWVVNRPLLAETKLSFEACDHNTVSFKKELYLKEVLHVDSKKLYVFKHESLNAYQMIVELIENYNPKEEN